MTEEKKDIREKQSVQDFKKTKAGRIKNVFLNREMQRSYIDYAMSVIVARALPDVRDGLKPVHRRILYAMHKMRLHYPARYTKSAKIVGETMGKYHPHGDGPIYQSLVRLAQDFSMRYPLVDGQGNFGSMDGDPPAAMRYTEARLTKISEEILADISKETVDFSDNFDGTLKEPNYLPAKLPNLLLAGSDGIAVGMATKIPPHNLKEVIDALTAFIDNTEAEYSQLSEEEKKLIEKEAEKDPFMDKKILSIAKSKIIIKNSLKIDKLLFYIQGPDFPTGGIIYNFEELKNAYTTGKGSITIRARAEIKDIGHGKSTIIVTELPYQINKARLISKIAKLVNNKKIEDISDLRDESDRDGVRIYIELKRKAVPKKSLNQLYKLTRLQTNYPINMVGLVGKKPQTLTLKKILSEFVKHRHKIIKRRSIYELRQAKKRAHILEGLKIAVDNIDEVIELIKKAADVDDAREKLMKKFKLSQIQAQAILDMQLKRLAALERKKIEDEYKELQKKITHLESLIKDPKRIFSVAKKELLELKEKYGDKRKTKIFKRKAGEFSDEDLIPNEKIIITLTKDGYIKRVEPSTYKVQRRGGKGVSGMTTKEEDMIKKIFFAETHDQILFFTNKGRVFQTRVWQLPEGSRKSKGKAIVNIIAAEADEKITSVLTYSAKKISKNGSFIFMATKKGTVKKTRLSDFANIRSTGIIAIKLSKGDQLQRVAVTTGKNHIMLVTKKGMSIRFSEKNVKPYQRASMGVRGIKLKKKDEVVALETFSAQKPKPEDKRRKFFRDILSIAKNGIGKRTSIKEFSLQKRGGIGLKLMKINKKTGELTAAFKVNHNTDQIVLTSKEGQIIKLPLRNIPQLKRNTQGVILMRFSKKNDKVASATKIQK